jgi:glyoxylase-like metal-dependent hydrolase (beta-lactamase superfamily II)
VTVRSFFHAESSTFTHVVADPASSRAAVIDAALDFDPASGRIGTESMMQVVQYLDRSGLGVDWVLETHAHADHLSAGGWLARRFGAQLGIGSGIVEVQRTFRDRLDLADVAADGSQFDRLFADGDACRLGSLEVRVIATPGHTADGVTYLVGDALFVGDTLFGPAAGSARCDFPGGDAATLYRSIRRLYAFEDTTRVFPCHDYPETGAEPLAQTTIGAQKAGNLHVRADTGEEEYVAMRRARDATLAVPKLLWPAIQFNLRGGRLPPASAQGRHFLKLPVHFDDAAG